MRIINLTPDSFWEPSRVSIDKFAQRLLCCDAEMVDIGAVSTRPGAKEVSEEEEWNRLEPAMREIAELQKAGTPLPLISIDTTSSEIVRRVEAVIGSFIVNDISAGEDDPMMLPTVAELKLSYIAMHKRGNPRTMDGLNDYPQGVVKGVKDYFNLFSVKAKLLGIDDWILDPGFGFAKDNAQNLELLLHLDEFKSMGRPILAGVADKRFTRSGMILPDGRELTSAIAEQIAVEKGADIIRTH